ncbi:MAG TPA: DUF4434 domain-containing protein [Bacillota bacterium]|nr:DUF4434 domain-containing protein [Bacillota bacterium]
MSEAETDTSKTPNANAELPFAKFERETLEADSMEAKCLPYPTGDFIQSWLCESWDKSMWKTHLMILQKAGIEFVILQFTTSRENGKYTAFYYPSQYAQDTELSISDCPTYNIVPNLLAAAKEVGMKVVLGLGGCSDWWSYAFKDLDWCETNANNTNLLIKELYDLYKGDYADTLTGWYWAWEMFGSKGNYEENLSKMININLDYMSELDASMPCMFSTYFSSYENVSNERFQKYWENLFSLTHFRKGDIWAPMDGLGSLSKLTYTRKEQLLQCYVNALKKNENISLWFNVENFVDGGGSADVNRYADQCDICSKYAEGLITFSYTHYYAVAQAGNAKYSLLYRKYLEYLEERYGITIIE